MKAYWVQVIPMDDLRLVCTAPYCRTYWALTGEPLSEYEVEITSGRLACIVCGRRGEDEGALRGRLAALRLGARRLAAGCFPLGGFCLLAGCFLGCRLFRRRFLGCCFLGRFLW